MLGQGIPLPAKADNDFQNGSDTDDKNTNQRTERGGTSGAVATDDGEPKLLEMGGAGTGNGADGGSGNSDESGVLVDEKTTADLLPDRINNCVPNLLVSAGDLAGSGGNLGAVGTVNLSTQLGPPRKSARISQPAESAAFVAKLSAQPAVAYKHSEWKRSRVKKGWLIKRLTGYSIAETEYGVSYLWVLSRKPDRTTADNSVYGLAGYFNWKSLEQSGLLRKEKKTK